MTENELKNLLAAVTPPDEAARAAHGIQSLPGTLKEAIDAMEEELEDLARAAQRLTVEMDEVRRGGRELEEEASSSSP